jgi:hypothetical protein
MHFNTKNYLKSNRYHAAKHILIPPTLTIISLHDTHESPNLLVKIVETRATKLCAVKLSRVVRINIVS